MNEMTLLVNAARTDPILRDAALAVEKRLLEAQRSYETAERAAVMWMERAEAAEAECARLQQALNVKRKDELIDGMVRFADDLEAGVIFVQDFPPELIRRLREALARSDTPADSHYRERPIEEDFYLDPRGEWVYRWSDERRVLKPADNQEDKT